MFERILVMESDAQIRRYMNSFLQNCKYRCTLTDKGRIGLSLLLEKPQDLIILDMDLKDCDSLLLLKKVREMTDNPRFIFSIGGYGYYFAEEWTL